MSTKQGVMIALVVALLSATISVDAVAPGSHPAVEPWTITRVDGDMVNTLGTHVSLAHHPISGRAFISYYDEGNQDLRVAYQVPAGSGDCGTANGWVCQVVDSEGDVGKNNSIAVTYVQAPFPQISFLRIGISYFDETNDALKYAEGYFLVFLSWNVYTIEDTTADASYGEFSAIKFTSDHKPRIAYHYSLNLTPSLGAVKYARFEGDGSGDCGGGDWYCDLVDAEQYKPDYGMHVSLDIDGNGRPRMAYYDPYNGDLLYAFFIMLVNDSCTNPAWACDIIDSVGDVGKFVSIHAPKSESDLLRFAYFDATENEVRYAYPEAGHGFVSFAVDSTGSIPGDMGLSLTVDAQGYPIIAYMNNESYGLGSDLKIARPAAAYGLVEGNCGHLKPFSMLPYQYWYCKTIRSGGEMTWVAEYAALSIDPAGLAAVAYFEQDIESRLMCARQWYTTYLPMIQK